MIAVKSAERMLLFTDAIAAIAITLLVLPLVDSVSDGVRGQVAPLDLVLESRAQIFSFALSFLVIARLWRVHNQLFARVRELSQWLVTLNFGWLLTIVLLPYPTDMVGLYNDDHFVAIFYTATILASSALQTALTFTVYAHPDLCEPGEEVTRSMRFGAAATTVALALALVLTVLVPAARYWALLSMLLVPVVARVLGGHNHRRR